MTRHLLISVALLLIGCATPALARWQPRFADTPPKIQRWYKSQHNSLGQWCCDEADGHPYFGGYALNKDGSVTLAFNGHELTIPSFKVLTGPNPTGHAVWWWLPGADRGQDGGRVTFCFAPGTLT